MAYTGVAYNAPFGASHLTAVENTIENTLELGMNVFYVGRVNNSFVQEAAGSNPAFANSLTVTCTDANASDCKAGTWTFNPGVTNMVIAFVEISGAGSSKLYELTNFGISGFWNTHDLLNGGGNIPKLSHMDFYAAIPNTSSAPVPEPVTLGLLGVGMAMLAGVRRRSRRQLV